MRKILLAGILAGMVALAAPGAFAGMVASFDNLAGIETSHVTNLAVSTTNKKEGTGSLYGLADTGAGSDAATVQTSQDLNVNAVGANTVRLWLYVSDISSIRTDEVSVWLFSGTPWSGNSLRFLFGGIQVGWNLLERPLAAADVVTGTFDLADVANYQIQVYGNGTVGTYDLYLDGLELTLAPIMIEPFDLNNHHSIEDNMYPHGFSEMRKEGTHSYTGTATTGPNGLANATIQTSEDLMIDAAGMNGVRFWVYIPQESLPVITRNEAEVLLQLFSDRTWIAVHARYIYWSGLKAGWNKLERAVGAADVKAGTFNWSDIANYKIEIYGNGTQFDVPFDVYVDGLMLVDLPMVTVEHFDNPSYYYALQTSYLDNLQWVGTGQKEGGRMVTGTGSTGAGGYEACTLQVSVDRNVDATGMVGVRLWLYIDDTSAIKADQVSLWLHSGSEWSGDRLRFLFNVQPGWNKLERLLSEADVTEGTFNVADIANWQIQIYGNGTPAAYAVAFDGLEMWKPGGMIEEPQTVKLGQIPALEDGTEVIARGVVVSKSFNDHFYAQEQDRSAGIRVDWSGSMSEGQEVEAHGILTTVGAERAIAASEVTVTGTPGVPEPLFMTCKAVGGAQAAGGVPIAGGTGLTNSGLLVRIAGKIVKQEYGGWFYVDDGSSVPADAGNVGVKVIDPLAFPPQNAFVVVTGVVAPELSGTEAIRVVKPFNADDVVIVQ